MQPTLPDNGSSHIIYKYPLNSAENKLILPVGSMVLHVESQYGIPTLWVAHRIYSDGVADTTETRYFEVHPTGLIIPVGPGGERRYVGTALISDALVFHVFERVSMVI